MAEGDVSIRGASGCLAGGERGIERGWDGEGEVSEEEKEDGGDVKHS